MKARGKGKSEGNFPLFPSAVLPPKTAFLTARGKGKSEGNFPSFPSCHFYPCFGGKFPCFFPLPREKGPGRETGKGKTPSKEGGFPLPGFPSFPITDFLQNQEKKAQRNWKQILEGKSA